MVTHRATEQLKPKNTLDQSGMVDRIRAQTNVVFIRFAINYTFTDPLSKRNFDLAYNCFKLSNTFDIHQDFSYRY